MNRLFLCLFLLITYNFASAQFVGQNAKDVKGIDRSSQTGSFSVDEFPIEMNLPKGFMFLNAKTTKDILGSWGKDTSSLNDVVGMIIPDDTASLQDIKKGWIINYQEVGHVQDNNASNMGFSWILKSIRNSEGYKYNRIGWAWTPKYDMKHHRLSLPLMYVSAGDSILNHSQYIFGNEGLIWVRPFVDTSDLQWLYDNDELINNSIGFTKGNRYEDFDSARQRNAYKSVSAFLKGIPTNDVTASDDEFQQTEEHSFSLPVIKILGIVSAVILGIMLILMLAVALTNKKKESGKDILQSGINILLRIGVFWMVYLLILTFAVFLVWLGIVVTIAVLSASFLSLRLLIVIIGGWVIIGGFLWVVVKSLFIFSHPKYPNRLEISQSDAPKLFSLIEEISQTLGEKMPKHVFVSPEVNAYVFYDRPFISLFFQRRKNIVIGLGLFSGLNKQELKAVIAHEYGHFGQKSMRMGQIVSVCHNIISNLVNSDDASILRPILRKTFVYVQRGYMKLSRSMEYEADGKSALVAGNKAAISALCKIEVIAERFDAYNTFVQNIYESKKILPSTYWNGYEQFLSLAQDFDGFIINETVTVSEPLSKATKSRVQLKNPWISHPLLSQRIDNILMTSRVCFPQGQEGVQDLVPTAVYDETSQRLFLNAGYTTDTLCSDSEYKILLAKELEENSFPRFMRVFFSREICGFELDSNDESSFSGGLEDVFSESNAHLVESYTTAISDYRVMVMFKNKQTTEKQIQYEGVVYNRKNVPVETQLKIVKDIEPLVVGIDKEICLYALSIAKNKELVKKAYNDIFYSQAIVRHIANVILPLRNQVAKQIGKGGNKDKESFNRIQSILLNFQADMCELMNSIEIERLNPVMHINAVDYFKRVEYEWLLNGSSIDGEEIQYILTLPDQIIANFHSLAYYSKKIVTDSIEGKTPLLFWNNSVEAYNRSADM